MNNITFDTYVSLIYTSIFISIHECPYMPATHQNRTGIKTHRDPDSEAAKHCNLQ